MNQLSVKDMHGGRSLEKRQQTNQKLHVSELLPLAAIPRVRRHPSTNVNRPGSQTDRAFSVSECLHLRAAVGHLPLVVILRAGRETLSYLDHRSQTETAVTHCMATTWLPGTTGDPCPFRPSVQPGRGASSGLRKCVL